MPPPADQMRPRQPSRTLLAIIGAIALAGFLRFWHIARESMWYDETFSVWLAQRNLRSMLHIMARFEANMALYYLALHGWLHFGEGEAAVRSLSAIAGILTVPAIFLLGRRLFDARVAVVSALLLAVNTFHIAYSQEARAYSSAVLLVTLASLFFVRAIETEKPRDWALYVLTAVAASYCQFFVWPVFIAQGLSLLALPRGNAPWRRFAASAVAIVLFCVPLIANILLDKTPHLSWIPRPGLSDLYKLLLDFAGVARHSRSAPVMVLVLLIVFLLPAVLVVRHLRADTTGLARWRAVLLLGWLLFPVLLTFGISQWKPIYVDRYFIVCLPAFLILLSVALLRMPSRAMAAALLLAIVFIEFQTIRSYEGNLVKEDWRDVTDYVLSQRKQSDGILFHMDWGQRPFEYYARLRGNPWDADSVLLSDADSSGASPNLLPTKRTRYPRTWLIQTRPIGSQPSASDAEVRNELEKENQEISERSFRGVDVTLYSANTRTMAISNSAAENSGTRTRKAHSIPHGSE